MLVWMCLWGWSHLVKKSFKICWIFQLFNIFLTWSRCWTSEIGLLRSRIRHCYVFTQGDLMSSFKETCPLWRLKINVFYFFFQNQKCSLFPRTLLIWYFINPNPSILVRGMYELYETNEGSISLMCFQKLADLRIECRLNYSPILIKFHRGN